MIATKNDEIVAVHDGSFLTQSIEEILSFSSSYLYEQVSIKRRVEKKQLL
jgi:hypothetical protein